MIRQKTGLDEDGVFAHTGALIVTRGEKGSTVRYGAREVAVPAVTPHSVVDPTGVGDAFRGGLLKGLATGADLEMGAGSAVWRRLTRSSTSEVRATPTRGTNSRSGTGRTSAGFRARFRWGE